MTDRTALDDIDLERPTPDEPTPDESALEQGEPGAVGTDRDEPEREEPERDEPGPRPTGPATVGQTSLMDDPGATEHTGADAPAHDQPSPPPAGPPAPPAPPTPPPPPPLPPSSGGSGGSMPPLPPAGSARGAKVPWYRVSVFRDPDDDMLGGVVSGISQAYGFDRRTSRLALVIAGLVLPIVILVYIVAWILLPDGRAQAQPLEDIVRDKRRFPLYAAIALVILVGGIGSLGSWLVFGDFPWGVGLIAIGVLLWMAPGLRRDRNTPAQNVASAPNVPVGAHAGPLPADGWPTPGTNYGTVTDAGNDLTTVMPPVVGGAPLGATASDGTTLVAPPITPRRRRRIPIGAMTLLAVLAFVGIASAGDALGWWDVPVLGVVVTSIAAMATGFAISTIVNRAWFFVPIVALLSLAAGFLAVAEPSLDGGIGDRTLRPATVTDAAVVHDLGVGQLTLDLVDVPLDIDTAVRVSAEVGVGRLHVIVPAGAELIIATDVGAGHVVVGDREVLEGVDQRDTRTVAPLGEREGTIELDLRIGMGEIDVDRDVFAVDAG